MGDLRVIKKKIVEILKRDDLEEIISEIRTFSAEKAVHSLFSALCNSDEKIKFHAVSCMGVVVGSIADSQMEPARVIMRRFIWSLNDESGGIGWGAPEAMGEVMACHEGLADEFAQILVSYMREQNYLEYVPLQRGLMWGLGRMACVRRAYLDKWNCAGYLLPYLESEDGVVRGLAAWTAGNLKIVAARDKLAAMVSDITEVRLYTDGRISIFTVGQLARNALNALRTT
ncbi:MAG: HEAT repeat domain-containing protein [Desulfobulbaceae bacterium]|nr:HEAT repeat domain-containing protein [Desulfobulbaceae bacterium]